MSSAPPIELFRGSGTWEECSEFIRAIRTAAWKEGKLRDTAWMADFASLHFTHEALMWYSQLPEDITQDWTKLQASILTRWAPSKEGDGPNNEPTPAAAPSSKPSAKADLPLLGIIKLVVIESNAELYVKFDSGSGFCGFTTDIKKALRIRCHHLSSGTLVERIDESPHSWLAVQWDSDSPALGTGSTNWSRLSFVDRDTLKSTWNNSGLRQFTRCTAAANGEAGLLWMDGTNKIPLFAFVNPTNFYFATNTEAYAEANPAEKQAKCFIVPVDSN